MEDADHTILYYTILYYTILNHIILSSIIRAVANLSVKVLCELWASVELQNQKQNQEKEVSTGVRIVTILPTTHISLLLSSVCLLHTISDFFLPRS